MKGGNNLQKFLKKVSVRKLQNERPAWPFDHLDWPLEWKSKKSSQSVSNSCEWRKSNQCSTLNYAPQWLPLFPILIHYDCHNSDCNEALTPWPVVIGLAGDLREAPFMGPLRLCITVTPGWVDFEVIWEGFRLGSVSYMIFICVINHGKFYWNWIEIEIIAVQLRMREWEWQQSIKFAARRMKGRKNGFRKES